MSRKNKWFIYTLCAFIVLSIYKDLTRVEDHSANSSVIQPSEEINKTYAIQRKVRRGETFLSIMEDIHKDVDVVLQIEKGMKDFKDINNGADPYNLHVQQSYYFPLYLH